MQKVNFKVLNIEKAMKKGCVVVTLKFDDSEKEYVYVRKANKNTTVIDGCRIYFNNEYKVVSIEREYETKGKKKTSTANQVTSTTEKIKNEITEKQIEIPTIPVVKKTKNGEIHHSKYEDIKTCMECGIPVYLAGPAGSGKNHTIEQIAKELGWEFYFSNSVQQEYKLTGFIDAGGDYHETEFYKACTSENECVFFLDEMDASIPEVLVLLNAAIANGYFEFPNGRVELDNVHFIAAGNTVGSGADEMYTGRMVLDQATLDRFAIIEFDYDLGIEMAITNDNTDLVNFIHDMRKQATNLGIRATYSYRCMTMVTKLEKSGMSLTKIIQMTVFKGMDKDTINTIPSLGSNKYYEALKKLKQVA